MGILILYATKSGAARECAELLASKMTDCRMCDLSSGSPDITKADTVIIGSGIRMGHIYKPARKFISENLDKLLQKKVAIYLCNAYEENLAKTIESDIPLILIKNALCVESFGGKPPFTNPRNKDWIQMDKVTAMLQAVETIGYKSL